MQISEKSLMGISHVFLSVLSDDGLIGLLKLPWAEILPLISLSGQLTN